jgi:hypothetical protein
MNERDVPYIAFESEMARHERTIKRLVVALVLTIALLFASNVAWLWFFDQFDFTSRTVMFDTDDGGDNSYIGNDGEINNGPADSN